MPLPLVCVGVLWCSIWVSVASRFWNTRTKPNRSRSKSSEAEENWFYFILITDDTDLACLWRTRILLLTDSHCRWMKCRLRRRLLRGDDDDNDVPPSPFPIIEWMDCGHCCCCCWCCCWGHHCLSKPPAPKYSTAGTFISPLWYSYCCFVFHVDLVVPHNNQLDPHIINPHKKHVAILLDAVLVYSIRDPSTHRSLLYCLWIA